MVNDDIEAKKKESKKNSNIKNEIQIKNPTYKTADYRKANCAAIEETRHRAMKTATLKHWNKLRKTKANVLS